MFRETPDRAGRTVRPFDGIGGNFASVVQRVHDDRRLAAVERSELVGSEREHLFDALTSEAARQLKAPFAFMTAVDDRISYWKSTVGIDDGTRFNAVEDSFCQYVIERGDELILGDVTSDAETRHNPSIESMGVKAWAGCPVVLDGEVLGTFCVVDQVPRSWSDRDRAVLRSLARAASFELGVRVELRTERSSTSDRLEEGNGSRLDSIRESLRAPTLPSTDRLDLAAWTKPAAGGDLLLGDFYDVFSLGDGVWGSVIGDVCGHGVDAARLTSLARHRFRSAAGRHDDPRDVVAEVDTALGESGIDPGRFVTAVFLRLDTRDGVVAQWARAGHTLPVLSSADGTVRLLDDAGGPPLGVLGIAGAAFTTGTVDLDAGDLLVLHTDGLTESRRVDDGTMLGEAGLRDLLTRRPMRLGDAAHAAVDLVRDEIEGGGFECRDDIAIVAIGPGTHSES